jgi:mannonate dehydratase
VKISRRSLIQSAGMAALASSPASAAGTMPENKFEGNDTPKICLALSDAGSGVGGRGQGSPQFTPEQMQARRLRQLGVDHVLSGGPRIPWEESQLKEQVAHLKANGLTLGNLMISGFDNAIYARSNRDDDIAKVIASIHAAGRAGLPVIEYNWYAHRAMEGYFEEEGRAGAGWTGFDYERLVDDSGKRVPFKELPALDREGAHTLDEMWTNISYFLKKVIPEAEKAGVRLALHPNDPPAPVSRQSQQIMGSVEGWKKLIDIVKSPCNGITFDCGVTREMGQDPVEVCRYFASRDRINHVHFRNVIVKKPYERYTEVFIDEGLNNMFAVMRELVKNQYTRLIYPEHPRAIDYDREFTTLRGYPGGGGYTAFAFNVGYTRAMMQAALTV